MPGAVTNGNHHRIAGAVMPLECVLCLWCVWLVAVKSMPTDWHSVCRNLRDKVSGPLLQDERFYRQGGWTWGTCDPGCDGSLSGGLTETGVLPVNQQEERTAPRSRGVPRMFKLKASCLPMTHGNPPFLNLAAPFSSSVCVSLHSRFLRAIALSLAVMCLFFHTFTVHF